jgi:uncharacterized protein YggE
VRRLLLAAALVLSALPAAAQVAQGQVAQGQINVIGRAIVTRPADLATVQIGVTTFGDTAGAALDANSAEAVRLIAFAKSFGVAEGDLRTSAVAVFPHSETVADPNGRARQERRGYQATNTVTVLLRDLPRLGGFLRDAVGSGANTITASASASPTRAKRRRPRGGLPSRMPAKAEALASAARVRLGRIVRIDSPPGSTRVSPAEASAARRGCRPAPRSRRGRPHRDQAEVDMSWAIEQPVT